MEHMVQLCLLHKEIVEVWSNWHLKGLLIPPGRLRVLSRFESEYLRIKMIDQNLLLKYVNEKPKRFWDKIDKTDYCWNWKKKPNKNGYGFFKFGGSNNVEAHRVSWLVNFGIIPEGMYICHKCDNPMCVRPTHLFLGTPADNSNDMIKKGRQPRIIGHRKINYEVADQIRKDQLSGMTNKELRERYGLAKSTISYIVNGKTWTSEAKIGGI
jgi:hypothetical protein